MKVELQFCDLAEDLTDAVISLSVQDHSEEDAPPQSLLETTVGPVTVRRLKPSVLVDVDFVAPVGRDARLIVQVKAGDSDQCSLFLNTSETPASGKSGETIQVELSCVT